MGEIIGDIIEILFIILEFLFFTIMLGILTAVGLIAFYLTLFNLGNLLNI